MLASADFETVAENGFGLLEGPRDDGTGIVFSDVLNGGVHRATPDGAIATVVPKRRGIGGILLHVEGGLVLSGRDLVHVRDGETRVVFEAGENAGYNDLGTLPDGRVLAGALRFRPFAGESPVAGAIWLVGPAGEASPFLEDVLWPNGIGIAPAGDRVYVSDYARECVLTWALGDDGIPGAQETFATAPEGSSCDGLAVDAEGGVWVALGAPGAIARYTPAGELDAVLDVPAAFASSVAFGGSDLRDLIVTTGGEPSGRVLRTRSEVAGAPVAEAAV